MRVSLRNLKGVRKRGKEGRGERAARVDHALDTSSAGCGRFLFVTVIAGETESSLSRGEVALLLMVYGRLLNARVGLEGWRRGAQQEMGSQSGNAFFTVITPRSLQWSSVRLVWVVGPVVGVGARKGCRWGMGLV